MEIREQIDSLKKIERQLITRVKNLEHNNKSDDEPYIEIKNMEETNVVFTRYNAPCNPDTFAMRYNELQNIILKEGLEMAGNCMAIFYDHYSVFDFDNADVEVCIPISNSQFTSKYVRKLPEGLYASILHKGSYDNAPKSYALLLEWLKENNYEIVGPPMENYIIDVSLTKNPQNYISEFQIPVKKLLTL